MGRWPRSSTRSSRSARRSGSTRDNFYLSASPGAASWPWSTPSRYQQHLQGAHHLEHDGEHPGLQRVRRAGADAAHGPGGAGRDQGASRRRATPTNPRYMELLISSSTTSSTCCGCRRTSGRTRCSRAFAHINPADLRVRCRGRASWASARASWRTGTGRRTWRKIDVPTLVIGAEYDTMDPAHMEMDGGQAAARPVPATARTAATWPCTTTSRSTSTGMIAFINKLRNGG